MKLNRGEPSQRVFLKLAIPNILTNLSVPLASLIDLALLGHLEDITPLAGVALAGLIFDFAYWGFGFLRMGTTGLIAKAYGEGNFQDSSEVFFRSFAIACFCGLMIVLLRNPAGELGFYLMNGEAAVKDAGFTYYSARIWGAPAVLGRFVIVGWLLGRHHAKSALLISLLLNGVNIFLDWLFIYRFGWGAAGAGWATMISEVFAFLFGCLIVRMVWQGHPRFQIGFLKRNFSEMLGLQANIMIRTFCLITTFALFTNLSAGFGVIVLAGNTILLRFLNTAAYFIDGFSHALESLAGKYKGAGQDQAVRRSLLISLAWNSVTVLLFIALFFGADTAVIGLLTDHQTVIDYAAARTFWLALALVFSGFAYIFDGYFIGLSSGKVLRNSMIVATVGGFVPFSIAAAYLNKPDLLWWGMLMFMVFRTLTLAPPALRRVDPKKV